MCELRSNSNLVGLSLRDATKTNLTVETVYFSVARGMYGSLRPLNTLGGRHKSSSVRAATNDGFLPLMLPGQPPSRARWKNLRREHWKGAP